MDLEQNARRPAISGRAGRSHWMQLLVAACAALLLGMQPATAKPNSKAVPAKAESKASAKAKAGSKEAAHKEKESAKVAGKNKVQGKSARQSSESGKFAKRGGKAARENDKADDSRTSSIAKGKRSKDDAKHPGSKLAEKRSAPSAADRQAERKLQAKLNDKKLSKKERLALQRELRQLESRQSEQHAAKADTPRESKRTEPRETLRAERRILASYAAEAPSARPTSVRVSAEQSRRAQRALAGYSELGSEDDQSATLLAYAPQTGRSEILSGGRSGVSFGKRSGLQHAPDPLELSSSVAYVMDPYSKEVIYSKNETSVLPIASITKLMTALVVTEARLPMDEPITITEEDVDYLKNSSSRLRPGTTLSRGQMLLLALMSSENRAAHSLGRTYPGGLQHFVSLMNQKAVQLGMRDTRYVDPTGLSSENQSSARDLATLVAYAAKDQTIATYSTATDYSVDTGSRMLDYRNSNGLTRSADWRIELQKTGYIREAGRCVVMQTVIAGRRLVVVLLDSTGRYSRTNDAERIRQWVEASSGYRQPSVTTASVDGQPRGNLMRAMTDSQ